MTVMRESHHQSVTATRTKISRRQRRERRLRYPWGRFSPLLRSGVRPLFAVGDAAACLATALVVNAGGQSTVGVTLVMVTLLALGGLNRSRLSLSALDDLPQIIRLWLVGAASAGRDLGGRHRLDAAGAALRGAAGHRDDAGAAVRVGPVLAYQGIGHPPDGGGRLGFAGADRGGRPRAAPGLRSSRRRVRRLTDPRGRAVLDPAAGRAVGAVFRAGLLTSPCGDRGPRRHHRRRAGHHGAQVPASAVRGLRPPAAVRGDARRRRHGRHRRPAAHPAAPVGVPESVMADQAGAGRRGVGVGDRPAVAAAGRDGPGGAPGDRSRGDLPSGARRVATVCRSS